MTSKAQAKTIQDDLHPSFIAYNFELCLRATQWFLLVLDEYENSITIVLTQMTRLPPSRFTSGTQFYPSCAVLSTSNDTSPGRVLL